MKKLLTIGLVAILCACFSTPVTNNDQLDTAIRETSDYLNANLTAGVKLAIVNIQSDYPALSEYIIDELIANTVNDRVFTVVDRQQLDAIRAEMDFQMSGEVDDATAQELGRLAGAQTIITGGVLKMGDVYRLRVRALNVQSAHIEGQFNRNIPAGQTINILVQSSPSGTRPAATQASSTQPSATTQTAAQTESAQQSQAADTSTQAQAAPAQTTPAAPAAPQVYRIGDTGPAGGIIFYDKGNNSGGWRYLEAAPVEAEFQAVMSVRNTGVDNTQETIGSGRRNTQLIVQAFSQVSGEWDTAAQKCNDLVLNGFDDWFLPSQAELDQMYGQLKRRNLGDFKNEWYWSSSGGKIWWGTIVGSMQNFADGRIDNSGSSNIYWSNRRNVRPIRQVAGQ